MLQTRLDLKDSQLGVARHPLLSSAVPSLGCGAEGLRDVPAALWWESASGCHTSVLKHEQSISFAEDRVERTKPRQ